MVFVGPTINIFVLVGAAAVLAVVVVIIGVKRGIQSIGYWLISTLIVVVMYATWQGLTHLVWGSVFTYTYWPDEQRFQVINIANGMVFLSLTLLLILIELKRSRPNSHQSLLGDGRDGEKWR